MKSFKLAYYRNLLALALISTPAVCQSVSTPSGYVMDGDATLQKAIDAAGSGILFLTKVWTLTGANGIRISTAGLTILCSGAGSLRAGASSFTMVTVAASNVTISPGCLIDGQYKQSTYTSVTGISVSAGVNNFQFSGTVQNLYGVGLRLTGANSGVSVRYARFLSIGDGKQHQGIDAIHFLNQDKLDIGFTECEDISGDCIYGGNDVSHPGTYNIHDNYGTNFHRQAIETQSIGSPAQWITNNRFDTFVGGGECLSIENTPEDPAIPYLTPNSLVVSGNFCSQSSTSAAGGIGLEIFGDYNLISNNTIWGDWGTPIGATGGGVIDSNIIDGGTNGAHSNGISFAPFVNTHVKPLIVSRNIITNNLGICISGRGYALIVSENQCNRAPGYFSKDSTSTYYGFLGGATPGTPLKVLGNTFTILPAVGGRIPSGFVWQGIRTTQAAGDGAIYSGNAFANQNSLPFGLAMTANGGASFNNSTISGQTYTNMATIGAYGGPTSLGFWGNVSLSGPGPSPVVDATTQGNSLSTLKFTATCTGPVANSANGVSLLGLGGTTLACNGSSANYLNSQSAPYDLNIVGIYVSSATVGADGSDGIFAVYADGSPTGVACTVGTSLVCSSATSGSIDAGHRISIVGSFHSTDLTQINVTVLATAKR